MASKEVTAKEQAKFLFWKGLWYIITGLGLILSALVFSGIALTFLEQQPGVSPVAPHAIFFVVLIIGTFWGGIVIWKGVHLISASLSQNVGDST